MTPDMLEKLRRLVKLAADERTPEPERNAAGIALAKRLVEEGVLEDLLAPKEAKQPTTEEVANELNVPVMTTCCICDYLAFATRMGMDAMLVAAFGGGWVANESSGGSMHVVPFCFRHKLAVARHVMEMSEAQRRGPRWHESEDVGDLFRERPKLGRKGEP